MIGELEEMGFAGYQQRPDELLAYILQKDIRIGDRERIDQLLAAYPGNNFIKGEEVVKQKNWNREWESTVKAVTVADFLIKPTWSGQAAAKDQVLLEIDPKMAFGTGYHATTRLILKMLAERNASGKDVLDAGTGTGILAIAAAKTGAEQVVAFDNDEWSFQNARENMWLNEVAGKIDLQKGSFEDVEINKKFDIILANINKNTILNFLPGFSSRLKKGGELLLAGILTEDEKEVRSRLATHHLSCIETKKEDKWLAVCADK